MGSGAFFFFGGLLMILASVMEFILGNTFSFVVFGAFGAFNLTFAATLQPFYNAYGAYAPAGEAASAGLETVGFNSSFGKFRGSPGRGLDSARLMRLLYSFCHAIYGCSVLDLSCLLTAHQSCICRYFLHFGPDIWFPCGCIFQPLSGQRPTCW
jgi:hypothetical protein